MKRLCIILCSALLLAACAERTDLAPVFTVNQVSAGYPEKLAVKDNITVEVLPGETLISIAKRFNMNYQDVAAVNHIDPPYTIHAGQVLLLSERESTPPVSAVANTQVFDYSEPKPQSVSLPVQAVTAKPVAVKSVVEKPLLPMAHSSTWRWPVRKGFIAKPYSANAQGMDIGVFEPEVVIAVSAGTVVYAGEDIAGDGNLIIIKHSGGFLSAYTYQSELLVKEGEELKAGQEIAYIKPSDPSPLHFDLRYQGRSVDPMHYIIST